jgi:O-methyltransferase involved in polyketide biosynthesis
MIQVNGMDHGAEVIISVEGLSMYIDDCKRAPDDGTLSVIPNEIYGFAF